VVVTLRFVRRGLLGISLASATLLAACSNPAPPAKDVTPAAKPAPAAPAKPAMSGGMKSFLTLAVGGLVLAWLGSVAPPAFLPHFTVFVLACFVGYMVIWNVTPALHTPLMSVTNAISSIIAIGAIIQISSPGALMTLLGGAALVLTTVNMVGGFAVTQRMLRMFRRSE